ncbi:MAG: hypothetical protein ACP5GU_01350 [Thermoprotei archaeon]|jgi:hypothetical protein
MNDEIEELMIYLNQNSTLGLGKALMSYKPRNKSIKKIYDTIINMMLLKGHEPQHVISYASYLLPRGTFLNYNVQNIIIGDRSAISRNINSIIISRKIQEIYRDFELWLSSMKMKTFLLTIMSSIFLAAMSRLPFILISKIEHYSDWFNFVPFLYGFLCITLAFLSSNIYGEKRFTLLISLLSLFSYTIMMIIINTLFKI